MSSLTPKLVNGHTYYYARYCQRVDGKPKITRTVYLGKLDDIVATIEGARRPLQPLETEVAAFGDVAALFQIADLYMRNERYEQAIVRLEEALSRYPDDGRVTRGRYMLAEAYRRSAARLPAALAEGQNLAERDKMMAEFRRRLHRAGELYAEVIATLEGDAADEGTGLEKAYVRSSHMFRADCAFDEASYLPTRGTEAFERAIRLYKVAAWKYRTHPIALSAYVQIIHCHLRMGDIARARATLERASWILRGIPEDPGVWRVPGESKQTWAEYLAWLRNTPTFRSP